LNNGVCHNSKEYPDLHTSANLVAMVGMPCNTNASEHEDVLDACEPEGDVLVIPSAGISTVIAHVELSPPEAATEDLTAVRVVLATPVAGSVTPGATDIEVRRGDVSFRFGPISYYTGASVADSDAQSITINLEGVDKSIKAFFDDRIYPWNDLMVRVGDPNENGTLGYGDSIRLIVPGEPMKSFIVLRLIDDSYGDLMPRQCRTWDDRATRALGCWIAGLELDDSGALVNADDPIDYDGCDFDATGLGKCGTGEDPDAIFNRSCGGSKCHVGEEQPAAGLDLSPGKGLGSLVGVASTEIPSKQLVAPGSPDQSYLMCKISEECGDRQGARMPSGLAPLPAADVEALRAWIAGGAE
jgi:hypothetical protein